ncbi:MAG: 2OG-Fe(II) oxygenase family protein [Pseudomonadales bacterium]|nr:2OG-Fe(II) oxygenase family protein [Pseudomonadales bacterium]
MKIEQTKDLSPLQIEAQHLGLFETPVVYSKLKDGEAVMQALEQCIRQRMSESDGLQRSNIGGWHSDSDMLEWGGDAARQVANSAVAIAKRLSTFMEGSVDDFDWFVRMWANVTPKHGLNHIHAHPGNLWAAVLYLDMGDGGSGSDVGGSLYMEDPRFPMAAMRETSLRMLGVGGQPQKYEVDFKLQRGNLVVFPAWLRHGVRPYTGAGERISIAMNIDAQRKRPG